LPESGAVQQLSGFIVVLIVQPMVCTGVLIPHPCGSYWRFRMFSRLDASRVSFKFGSPVGTTQTGYRLYFTLPVGLFQVTM